MFRQSLRAACALVIFLVSLPLFSQSVGGSSGGMESQAISLSQDPGSVSISGTYENFQPDSDGSPSTLGLVVRMVLMLAVVLAVVYGVMRLLRRSLGGMPDTEDPFLRRVSQVTLAPGKTVQVVTILDHAYIVGVSDSSVSLLGEITDKEIVDSMNLLSDRTNRTKKPMSFSDVLDLFTGKGASRRTGFSDFAKDAAEGLKRQREHFNNRGN